MKYRLDAPASLLLDCLKRTNSRLMRRKLQLFCVACCKTLWDELSPLGHAWVRFAETHCELVNPPMNDMFFHPPRDEADYLALITKRDTAFWAAVEIAKSPRIPEDVGNRVFWDIFPHPDLPIPFRKEWLTRRVIELARLADSKKGFDESVLLPLADALEEGGCTHPHCVHCINGIWGEYENGDEIRCDECHTHSLLAHLRAPGPHYRGCWAIDFLRRVAPKMKG